MQKRSLICTDDGIKLKLLLNHAADQHHSSRSKVLLQGDQRHHADRHTLSDKRKHIAPLLTSTRNILHFVLGLPHIWLMDLSL